MSIIMLINLFYFSISLVLICVSSAYTPPMAKVEPLYPKGIRISIPDEEGISLVAFHVNVNEEFEGIEAGTIARDVLRVRNGRWKYEDHTTQLKFGDKVYYWVHVVYQGLGYNLLFQQHEVTEFYNKDGTRITAGTSPTVIDRSKPLTGSTDCQFSETIVVNVKTQIPKRICKGALLLEDEFNSLNSSTWRIIEQFSRIPDYPFVVYRNDLRNVKTESGTLRLIPMLLEQEYGRDFIRHGSLNLPKCTREVGSAYCKRDARGPYILPPVSSGAVDTKQSLIFMYGKIEIRAKLPKGDWIYPIITLESFGNDDNNPDNHQQLRIVEALGNIELITEDGADVSGHVLSGGPISQLNPVDNGRNQRPRRHSTNLWSDDYHNYELEWRKNRISLKVDDTEYGNINVDSTFDKPFYLTLAIGAGGYTEFPDKCTSGSYKKPWKNVGSRALFDFFNSTELWSKSWGNNDRELNIDWVKITAL